MRSHHRRGLHAALIALAVLALVVGVSSALDPTQYKVFRHGFSGIEDHQLFDSRKLPASPSPQPLAAWAREGDRTSELTAGPDTGAVPLASWLEASDTVAFVILKDGKVFYEHYFDGYEAGRPVTIYSITKSILSLLVGLAVEDGAIVSTDQPVRDFLAGFRRPGLGEIRIRHLLQMTSGLPYRERGNMNPFGLHAHLSYTDDIAGLLGALRPGVPPGTHFEYKSVDYALLGQLLDRALGEESLTRYLQRRLWDPLGAVHAGQWSIDSMAHGLEKTWCCLVMTARDLARFGLLMQRRGEWNGVQLVPPSWIDASLATDTRQGSLANYQLGWWLIPGDPSAFRAEGILGQYLYVNPDRGVVIVRFGTSMGGRAWTDWLQLFASLARQVSGAAAS